MTFYVIKRILFSFLIMIMNISWVEAGISIVPSSDLTGFEICKPDFNHPQCKSAYFSNNRNIAYQGNGFARPAVAKDNIHGHDSIHQPEFANDGAYGNGTSWISNSSYSWIKIDLGRSLEIDRIMFGRDRLGFYDDRDPGQILVSVAMNDEVYASGDDSNDESEYIQVFDSNDFNFSGIVSGGETVQVEFPSVVARFVKLTVANRGTALDEIEVLTPLVAYYPFSGDVQDISGNENHGIVYGATLTRDRCGIPNSAYNFNGIDSCILANDSESLDVRNSISMSAWVKKEGSHNSIATIVAKHYTHFSRAYTLFDSGGISGRNEGIVQELIDINNTVYETAPVMINNDWHLVTSTYDNSQGVMKLFIDGVLMETKSIGQMDLMQTSVPLSIGCYLKSNDGSSRRSFFRGTIDEVRVYERALSEEEVYELYEAGSCDDLGNFIEISEFEVVIGDDNVLHSTWKTGVEIDNLGMNLWCTQMKNNKFENITKLNGEKVIPTKAIFPDGASYSSENYPWINGNGLKSGVQYCTLEDIDTHGECNLHCDFINAVVVGNNKNLAEDDFNQLNIKAKQLCNKHKVALKMVGKEKECLDRLLISARRMR